MTQNPVPDVLHQTFGECGCLGADSRKTSPRLWSLTRCVLLIFDLHVCKQSAWHCKRRLCKDEVAKRGQGKSSQERIESWEVRNDSDAVHDVSKEPFTNLGRIALANTKSRPNSRWVWTCARRSAKSSEFPDSHEGFTLCVYRVCVMSVMMVLYGAIVHHTDDNFLLKDVWIKASSSWEMQSRLIVWQFRRQSMSWFIMIFTGE